MIGKGIRRGCGATLVFESVPLPAEFLFGNCAWHLSDSFSRPLGAA
jgi:hypothetical protein